MAYTGAHYMLLSAAINGSLSCADKRSPSVSGEISCFLHKELNSQSSDKSIHIKDLVNNKGSINCIC